MSASTERRHVRARRIAERVAVLCSVKHLVPMTELTHLPLFLSAVGALRSTTH
jgi:hypothetical protein